MHAAHRQSCKCRRPPEGTTFLMEVVELLEPKIPEGRCEDSWRMPRAKRGLALKPAIQEGAPGGGALLPLFQKLYGAECHKVEITYAQAISGQRPCERVRTARSTVPDSAALVPTAQQQE